MKHYTTNKRYCPHEITTKLHSVQIYRQTGDISYVCRKYKISKASLMRWNKAYDGTRESLIPKSHRPHSPYRTPILSKRSSGSRTTTEGIPTYLWVSCMGNCARRRHIPVIPAHCIGYLCVLDSAKRQNLQRKSRYITSLMTLPL